MDIEMFTWDVPGGIIQRSRVLIPAVVVRGVDGAVREVGSSAELWQTLGVEQRPRATLVGRKLQTHAYGNKKMKTNVMSAC